MANLFMAFGIISALQYFTISDCNGRGSSMRLNWIAEFKVVAHSPFLAHDSFMSTDERMSPERIAELRAMTGAQKLRMAEQLYWSARKAKAEELRNQHPDWPEERVNDAVREFFTHAGT
jgi:hypothetical protein